jgi:hypothetical protein
VFPDAPVGGATMAYGMYNPFLTIILTDSPLQRISPRGSKTVRDTGNPQDWRIAKNIGSNKVQEATTKIWAVQTSASCRIAIHEALVHAGGQAD